MRRVLLAFLLAALLVGWVGRLVWRAGEDEATARPIRRTAVIGLDGWPAQEPPVRVALLADIHLGNRAMTAARLWSVVNQVNAARPDLILIAGDFVADGGAGAPLDRSEALVAPLSHLRATLGVVAVLGNHDHWSDVDAVRAAVTRAGVLVLDNDAVQRGPLRILGVDDSYSGFANVRRSEFAAGRVNGVPIVLSHTPDVVHDLHMPVQLVVAGHTHCGQVVLPLLGAVMKRSGGRPVYDPRYRCGLVQSGGRTVVVTAGLGASILPIRLGAPPDWWLLEIGPGQQDAEL